VVNNIGEPRQATAIIAAQRTMEGAGFPVRRPFPTSELVDVDPFLMLDEVGPVDYAPGEAKGAPDHPHRGFETISYILSGEKLHEDSQGATQLLTPGDVQWMTAGAGIVHSEMPSPAFFAQGGRSHGFQIWVNLPKAEKSAEPGYQYIPAGEIPATQTPDNLCRGIIIAGDAFGVSASINTRTPVVLQDWTIDPGGKLELSLPPSHTVAIYLFQGEALTGPDEKRIVDGDIAIMGGGDCIVVDVPATAQTARFLLLGGTPINEPVARYGPFVMNTREEIMQAMQDYQAGLMGAIER
jgi:redox-sensitive bicupin YhaK (pirin superfamily)